MCRSAYLHVPFCQDICSYCDFTRCRYHAGLANQWLDSIQQDILMQLQGLTLETMYIGGGTPSALQPHQLSVLLAALQPYTKTCKEYTIEANVESLTAEKLRLCKAYGVNRISLGVQTLQPALLKVINRQHSKENVIQAIQLIHESGIHNISIDLIYGLPQQTMELWRQDLQEVIEHFEISHISLYALTIEEHSTFGRSNVQPMDSDLEADLYEYAIAYLTNHGYEHYEISSFAKDNLRSRHNQAYWHYDDFVGLGIGASGKQHHQRYDNTSNLHTYLTLGASPEYIPLEPVDEMFEMVMMSLRMKQGMSRQQFLNRFGKDVMEVYAEVIEEQLDRGMLELTATYLKASAAGWLLLNDVLTAFLPE